MGAKQNLDWDKLIKEIEGLENAIYSEAEIDYEDYDFWAYIDLENEY